MSSSDDDCPDLLILVGSGRKVKWQGGVLAFVQYGVRSPLLDTLQRCYDITATP